MKLSMLILKYLALLLKKDNLAVDAPSPPKLYSTMQNVSFFRLPRFNFNLIISKISA